jgi:Domain of unknown function (DUF4402)
VGTISKLWARAIAVGAIFSPAVALAAGAGAPTEAVLLRPLSIVNTDDLQFGTMLRGVTAGTVVIDPFTDARSTTGGVTAAGGSPAAARFVTYGGPLQTLQVNRGPLPVLTNGTGGTMNVTQLTLNGPVNRFLTAAGVLDLRVGGTLAVAANQPEGVYSGTFQIIVTYF